MNNQIPFGFMPPFNFEHNEIKQLNDRISNIEKKISKLEKKVEVLESKNVYPMSPNFPNNYMM